MVAARTEAIVGRKKLGRETSRVEFIADAAWLEKVQSAADRVGLNLSSYIRLAVNRLMNDPEFAPPAKAEKRKEK
jgi:hypothetical protein